MFQYGDKIKILRTEESEKWASFRGTESRIGMEAMVITVREHDDGLVTVETNHGLWPIQCLEKVE